MTITVKDTMACLDVSRSILDTLRSLDRFSGKKISDGEFIAFAILLGFVNGRPKSIYTSFEGHYLDEFFKKCDYTSELELLDMDVVWNSEELDVSLYYKKDLSQKYDVELKVLEQKQQVLCGRIDELERLETLSEATCKSGGMVSSLGDYDKKAFIPRLRQLYRKSREVQNRIIKILKKQKAQERARSRTSSHVKVERVSDLVEPYLFKKRQLARKKREQCKSKGLNANVIRIYY